jgi:DNA processing protein
MAKDLRSWFVLLRAMAAHGGRSELLGLLDELGSPEALLSLAPRALRSRLPPALAEALGAPDAVRIEADLAWLSGADISLIGHGDPAYPPLLAGIPDPPLALFVRGDVGVLSEPQLAIVGSRNPTPGGRDTAQAFASHLARCGLTITSGLAAGIDAAAHEGALDGGGATVAVCGTGLDAVYPAANRELAHRIVTRGALVSEFLPGTRPVQRNFPERNRIIAGLSLGTLVVEAALRSGSLITARLASEQGREVFAIPGSIHNPLAKGCHRLLRDGAKLVEQASDVLEELGPLAALATDMSGADPTPRSPQRVRDPEQRRVLEALGHDPVPVDLLVERTGLAAAVLSSILLILELEGQVSATPGGRYARVIRGE